MPFITQVLLPKRDNSGRLFDRETYRAFHARMIRRFGGWTRKGQAEGAWLSPSGQLFTEEHWVYEIGHSHRDLRFWQAEKERLREEFDQESIWIIQYEGRMNNCRRRRVLMSRSSASALVIDKGRRVLLRLRGRFYQVTQEELRIALGLPAGPPGLGITIDGERLHLEFPADNQAAKISAGQLQRLLVKKVLLKT